MYGYEQLITPSIIGIAIIICFIKSLKGVKEADNKAPAIICSIITFFGTFALDFIFLVRCGCGYPLLGLASMYFTLACIIFNWWLLFKKIKTLESKHIAIAFVLIIVEFLLIFGLNIVLPTDYHKDMYINSI